MGGGKLVHVGIVVAAIFDFMTEEDWERSFNMALSREKKFARPKKTPALQAKSQGKTRNKNEQQIL